MQKFLEKDMSDVEWVGSPSVPEQLLAASQAALVVKGMPDWVCLPEPPLIDLIASVQDMGQRMELILEHGVDASEAVQEKIEKLHSEKTSIKRALRAFNAGTWQFLCTAALQIHSDDVMADIESALDRAMRAKLSRGSARSSGSRTPQRFVIEKEKSEDEAPISLEDSMKLNEYVRRKATKEITIEDARILLDCMGNFIDNLFPGGADLRHVKMSNELRNYFPAVRRDLCGEQASLHSFPEVALARLLTLRLSKEDGFMLDMFGLVMVKDVSMTQNTTKAVRLRGKDVDVRRPRNDQWLPVFSIKAMKHVMEGIATATQALLHPSILCHTQLRALGALITKAWIESGGYMEINALYEIFQTRLEEHAVSVRAKVAGEIELLPHLCTLGPRSSPMMVQAKATAKIRYLSLGAMIKHKKGLKETVVGAKEKDPLARNSEGDLR